MRAALLIAALAAPLHGQVASAGSVRLALLEEIGTSLSLSLPATLEALSRERASSVIMRENQVIPGYYSGDDFFLKIPRADFQTSTQPAVALVSGQETAVIYPPVPSFVEALLRAAADPATFQNQAVFRFSTAPLTVSLTRTFEGEGLISARRGLELPPGSQWNNTVAAFHRLSWEGKEITVAEAGKVFSSLGRMATALEREKANGPPIIGLSRGRVFGTPTSDLHGAALARALEQLGLRFSAVSGAELRNWQQLHAYRQERPDGIRFLSANLSYSSAPAITLLPAHALVEAGGLRVAVVGITPPSAARYLPEAGLSHAQIADPVASLRPRLAKLRQEADLVVLLCELGPDTTMLRYVAGADVVLADDVEDLDSPPSAEAFQADRGPLDWPLWTMQSFYRSLDVLETAMTRSAHTTSLRIKESHIPLAPSIQPHQDFPLFDPASFGITRSTEPPLIPAAQRIFPGRSPRGNRTAALEFWTMAASLLAEDSQAELAILPAHPQPIQLSDSMDVPEGVARLWLETGENLALARMNGAQVRAALGEAKRLAAAHSRGELPSDVLPLALGAMSQDGLVHGLPLQDDSFYRVATTRSLAAAKGWEQDPAGPGTTVDDAALKALRRRQGSPARSYRDWMEGRPVRERGLWEINFRDAALNIQNTKIVRDDAFDTVPNSRIQGNDELLIGGVLKTDADYFLSRYKWSNSLELEYARSRLRPRNQATVSNLTANRASFLTSATRRAGAVWARWLAQSWGPSLALQYEGQLENTPPLRRRQVYSAYPGVEFYDGTFVRTLRLAANIKRDLSRDPPDTQYGLRTRALVSHSWGPAPLSLEGEFWANYFFLAPRDQPQDLRLEANANIKLRFPIRKYLNISPFIDYYVFCLKSRPIWGYSAMTGITIGFSRLWKPQYERF